MYSRILLAIDPDRPGSWAGALPTAAALARCFSADLTICSIVSSAETAIETEWSSIGFRAMLEIARARLAEIASGADMPIKLEVGTGTVCGGILDVALRIHADLIVLASHEPALKDHLWSANAARVARRAGCSVFVVRGRDGGARDGLDQASTGRHRSAGARTNRITATTGEAR